MKNSIRQLLSLAMVLILILSTATVLSGCYIVNSGKMKKVEGTYELTTYKGDSDWLTERGIKLIMVIRADGTGYYGYKDNNTKPFVAELRCRFTADPDDSNKYEYIEIDFEGNGEYEKFAINAGTWRKQTNLNSQKPKWKGNLFEGTAEIDYQIHVDFTRIDKTTDKSVIDENFSGAPILPYGIRKHSGAYEFKTLEGDIYTDTVEYIPQSSLVYLYLDLNFSSGNGTAYYMLKSNEEAKVITFDLRASTNENGEFTLMLGDVPAKIVNGEFYSTHIHISRQDTEYLKLDYIGTISPELLTAYAENAYASYLAGLDVSQQNSK